jgi:hypothetical protein
MYPRFWLGTAHIRSAATPELDAFRARLRGYYLLVTAVPLTAAVLVFLDPGEQPRYIAAVLAGLALFGVIFDTSVSHGVAHFVYAFRERRAGRAR